MAALYGHLQEFKHEEEEISTYLERVELFFVANETPAAKQVPIFLNVVGATTFGLLRSLLAPDEPKTKSMAELAAALKGHFEPKRNIVAERFHFHRRNQKTDENVTQYVAELRRLAARCAFARDYLEEALRDRFVCGVSNEATQRKLLTEGDVKLSKAVEIAQSMEAAHIQAQSLKTTQSTADLSVGAVTSQPTPQPELSVDFTSNAPSEACYRCGRTGHFASECPSREATCHRCRKRGHLARACRGGRGRPRSARGGRANLISHSDEMPEGEDVIRSVNSEGPSKPYKVTLIVNGKPLEMEIDTGAAVSIISKSTMKSLFSPCALTETSLNLRTYTSESIMVLGQMTAEVCYNGYVGTHQLFVVDGSGPSLLGRDWLNKIRLDWASIKSVVNRDVQSMTKEIFTKYREVFGTDPGLMQGMRAHLTMKEGSQPRFCRPRSVPYAIKEQVGRELNRLEETGTLRKVDYAEWAAPIVPVPKKDGSIRICGDYKVTINPSLQVDQYPLPKPTDLMTCLTGGQQFSQLDLSSAYQQIALDDESAGLVTINTHQGLYEYTRLPFGVASAPAIFQKAMDGMLQGIPHCICYLDDILVTGRTAEEHRQNLEMVLSRLQERGMRLRQDKCRLFQDSVDYLGHTIDAQGVHTSDKKVRAIVGAPSPRNIQELRSFLGLLNYYGKFLPNLAMTLHPLHKLLRAGQPWVWSSKCQRAFETAKRKLVDAPVLAHYDPQLPIVLAGDASAYGLGAVISHRLPDGSERPVAFASRTLTSSEQNYPQVEREALSLVFGIKHFHQYLYGRQFILLTDHKPLTTILGPKQSVPPLAAARMQRWALMLSAYSYTIQFRPTESHANADMLSRLPLAAESTVGNPVDTSVFNMKQIETLPVHASEVAEATRKDPILSKVMGFMKQGWPHKVPETLLPYWRKQNELTMEASCILWGVRVVIPMKLQEKVLNEIHLGHQGVGRMKSLARSYVWWPGIDKKLEETAKGCTACQEQSNSPVKAPLHPWSWPTIPWERVHIDFAGPVLGKMLLVMVDAHSKWPEIQLMNKTSASKTIAVLQEVFARNGIPRVLVSDNGPQFIAEEFSQFMSANGIRHIRSSPYHPASNGAAERLVQTVKRAIYTGHKQGTVMEKALARFLLQYRNTPHATTGVSPSSLFMGRALRTRLDLLKPDVRAHVQNQQEKQKLHHDQHSSSRSFSVGQTVWTRNFRDGPRWIRGVVADRLGPLSYLVRMPDGALWRRHVDQLRPNGGEVATEAAEDPEPEPVDVTPTLPTPTQESFHPLQENSQPDLTSQEPEDTRSELGSELSSESTSLVESATSTSRYPSRNRRPPVRFYGTLDNGN